MSFHPLSQSSISPSQTTTIPPFAIRTRPSPSPFQDRQSHGRRRDRDTPQTPPTIRPVLPGMAQALQAELPSLPDRPAAPPISGGQRLPTTVQQQMESAFGRDFTSVRIHEGEEASTLGALAYTQGTHLYFAPGQYRPDRPSGLQLLGHELTHVVQQAQGRVKPSSQSSGIPINAEPHLEHEADVIGDRVARGQSLPPEFGHFLPSIPIQSATSLPAQRNGATFTYQGKTYDLQADQKDLIKQASHGLLKALKAEMGHEKAGLRKSALRYVAGQVNNKLRANRPRRSTQTGPGFHFDPPPSGTIPFVSNETFRLGKSGASALSLTRAHALNLLDAQVMASPMSLSDAENQFFLDQLSKRQKQGGNSYVQSILDKQGRTTQTFGFVDPVTDRSGRDTTPATPAMKIGDEQGHGFPQSLVVDPSSADQSKHMYAETKLANQGTTREVEELAKRLAQEDPDREVVKHRIGILGTQDERPIGFQERVLRRTNSGNHFELIATLLQNNPVIDPSTQDVLETVDETTLRKALEEQLKNH